ncbi:hypothetical protein VZT92_023137 [Zoarces viviparus]|uniref:Uncharacterized protein n=1 Tax=Zoarces viviparus TaxID=48416 RepID=A0AAW1E6F5_ZOAVI
MLPHASGHVASAPSCFGSASPSGTYLRVSMDISHKNNAANGPPTPDLQDLTPGGSGKRLHRLFKQECCTKRRSG